MGVQIQGDTGNVIATKGTYSGDVSIGGTLTYEDVTNIDSVGLITARSGLEIGARPGVAASVSVDGNAIFSGITTVSDKLMVGDLQIPDADLHVHGNLLLEDTIGNNLRVRSTVNNGNDPNIRFQKGRGGGTPAVVQDGDDIGDLSWAGYDGDTYEVGADILGEVDGTPSDGDMPTRLTFKTRSAGAASAQGRLRIHADGLVSLENNSNLQIPDKIIHSADTDTAIRFPAADTISAETGGSERLRIDSLGQVGINTASPTCQLEVVNSKTKTWTPTTQTELLVERQGNCIMSIVGNNDADCILNFGDSDDENPGAINYDHATDNMIFRVNSGNRAKFLTDGRFVLGSPTVNTTVDYSVVTQGRIQSDGSYNATSSSSANLRIGTGGLLSRSTSSARYKKDITDATWGLADVLKLKPKTFKSNATGEDADDNTYGGFIAEDVHDIGLTNFVEYNSDNQPDAIHYGNMVALMTKAIQELSAKNDALEARIKTLEG